MAEESHLVLHEKRLVAGQLQQRAYNSFSDQTKHSWFFAIPAMHWYVARRKTLVKQQFKLVNSWRDRGLEDFWCASAHIYPSDAVEKTKVPILAATKGSGRCKCYLDQIGRTIQTNGDLANTNDSVSFEFGLKAVQMMTLTS